MTSLPGFEIYKIALPAALAGLDRLLGIRKWLRERALRIPTDKVQSAVDYANTELRRTDPGAAPITIAVWRSVEATQGQIIGDGIQARVTPKL